MPISVVIKSFPYASDGINTELLKPGTKLDFGVATKGLTAEKYIEPAKGEKTIAIEPAVNEPVEVVPAVVEPVVEPAKPHGKKKTK